MNHLSKQFKNTVKNILHEEIEKSVTDKKIFKRVPEVVDGKDLKKITPHPTESKSKQEILDDIKKAVDGINKEFEVVWDDHDDIHIEAEDLFKIRIIPRWENNFNIEAYTKNEDRIYITGQTLEQVKEFVKENLKSKDTNTEKAYKKSIDNEKEKPIDAPDKGLQQKNKTEHKKVTETPNKNKDFNQPDKNEQNEPMREVKSKKTQMDHSTKGVKPTYKFPKQKDNRLVIKNK